MTFEALVAHGSFGDIGYNHDDGILDRVHEPTQTGSDAGVEDTTPWGAYIVYQALEPGQKSPVENSMLNVGVLEMRRLRFLSSHDVGG